MTSITTPISTLRIDAARLRKGSTQCCWRALLAPGGILAALVALQAYYLTGPIASDDFAYLRIAQDPFALARGGEYVQLEARWIIWLPVRWLMLSGIDGWYAVLPLPWISAVTCLLLTYRMGARFVNPACGLLAMATLGLVPQLVVAATVLLPDVVATVFVMLGLSLLIPQMIAVGMRPSLREVALCALGGLILAAGFNAKEPTLLFLPALGLYVLWRHPKCRWAWAKLAVMYLGAGIWLLGETATFKLLVGDPWFHWRAITHAHEIYPVPFADQSWTTFLRYWLDFPRWLVDPAGYFGPWGVVFLAAIPYCWMRCRDDVTVLLTCCVVVVGGYLSLGSANLFHYVPIYHQPRYLLPLLPVGAILAARMLQDLYSRGLTTRAALSTATCRRWSALPRTRPLSRWIAIAVGAAFVVVSLPAPRILAGRWHHAAEHRAGRAVLDSDEDGELLNKPWVASRTTSERLGFLRGTSNTHAIGPLGSIPMGHDDWLKHYRDRLVWVLKEDREAVDDEGTAYLGQRSYASLQMFPRVAVHAVPTGNPNEWDQSHRVEIFHITD